MLAKKSNYYRHFNKAIKFLSHAYINDIKSYGSIRGNIEYQTKAVGGLRGEYGDIETFNGEFYPFIALSEKSSGESTTYGDNHVFKICFDFYVLPKNDESINSIVNTTTNRVVDLHSDNKFQIFNVGELNILYNIPNPNDSIMKNSNSKNNFGLKYIEISSQRMRKFILKDKKSAVSLKKNILGCFEQGSLYPSMDNSYQSSHDQIKNFLYKSGFTLEYGHTIDNIYDDIYSYSSNNFYVE